MFENCLDDMLIYAQTIGLPDEDRYSYELYCSGLSVGAINQSEVRGRVNMAIELFHNSFYSIRGLDMFGLHAAIYASNAESNEDSRALVEEAQRRGYEVPTDFDPVLCGIVTSGEKVVPMDFHKAMLSLGLERFDSVIESQLEYQPLVKSLESYLALPEEQLIEAQVTHYKNNEAWFFQQLARLDADWLMVGGNSGTIYLDGKMNDFPDGDTKKEVFELAGEVIFTWGRPPVVESDD